MHTHLLSKVLSLAGRLACAILGFLLFSSVAHAQVPASRMIEDIWGIAMPIFGLAFSTAGTILIPWLAAKLISLISIQDENAKKSLESEFRDALHQSATNAVKYVISKFGLPSIGSIDPASAMIKEAIKYVQDKNPGTVKHFDLNQKDLAEIIMSKVPDIIGMVGHDVKSSPSVAKK